MITKTGTTRPASPVTARMMLTAAPMPTDTKGFTFGSVVLKLLAAMKAEKQADGNAAIASRKAIHLNAVGPRITGMRLTGFRMKLPAAFPAATACSVVLAEP